MAGMKSVELETLRKLMFLLDGWWNIFQSAVRPAAVVAMLEMDEPKKAIDFLRKTCNDYCDQLEAALSNPTFEESGVALIKDSDSLRS